MGKFKFEVLGIGEIGASQPKCNSILVVESDDNIKTKITAKGVVLKTTQIEIQHTYFNDQYSKFK